MALGALLQIEPTALVLPLPRNEDPMADIHALEIEFAKNPTLEACIPLCEAYLGQKRFMEAMVVCKKGIKGAPQDARGRAMLARVYLEQGKAPKAQQELEGALAELQNNPLLLEMYGKVLVDQGQRDQGVQKLQQALALDPLEHHTPGFRRADDFFEGRAASAFQEPQLVDAAIAFGLQ